MANQQINRIRTQNFDGVPPPPRALLWGTVGLFILAILGGFGGILFLQVRPSLSVLLGVAIITLPILTGSSLLGAILFRKHLPHHAALWLGAVWLLLWLVGATAFALFFRNGLAPGQRETVKHYLPFMVIFSPPLPAADSSLPTPVPNQEGGISAQDLLTAPLGGATAITQPTQQAEPTQQAVVPVQITSTLQPTITSEVTIPPTETSVATQVAVAPTIVPQAEAVQSARPSAAQLGGITPVKQGWNNCGPANITMALSYYGWTQTQEYALNFLKPDREDKNVNPWELVDFVNQQSQVRALYRVGGDMELIKRLLANKLPVIIETGYMFEGSDWLGHYQTVVGYDDSQDIFYVYDSYLGTGENGNGMAKSYADFDQFWENFNRTFIVLYKPTEEILVRDILGERADEKRAFELAAETAQAEARSNPTNAFAWFNLGSSLTRLGKYDLAAGAFDKARQERIHWRMTLYQFDIFEAYFNIGRYDDILSILDANLLNGGQYVEETHFWQGKVFAQKGDSVKAASAFRQALSHNSRFTAAQDALNALPN